MGKAFTLLFVWGPAMVGFALGWLIPHPDDWTGPAVIAPLGLVLTGATYRWGFAKYRSVPDQIRPHYIAGMITGGLVGVMIFAMLALRIIG